MYLIAEIVAVLAFLLLLLGTVFIAIAPALKGKWGMFVLGVFLPIVSIVSAIRLAKPDSFWARHFYGPDKLGAARERFPERDYRPQAPVRPDLRGWRPGA